jgi:hypothetical protein
MMKFSPNTQRLQLFYHSSKGYSAWSATPNELRTSKTRVYENKILNRIFAPNNSKKVRPEVSINNT